VHFIRTVERTANGQRRSRRLVERPFSPSPFARKLTTEPSRAGGWLATVPRLHAADTRHTAIVHAANDCDSSHAAGHRYSPAAGQNRYTARRAADSSHPARRHSLLVVGVELDPKYVYFARETHPVERTDSSCCSLASIQYSSISHKGC
jgi:hypothetical protein